MISNDDPQATKKTHLAPSMLRMTTKLDAASSMMVPVVMISSADGKTLRSIFRHWNLPEHKKTVTVEISRTLQLNARPSKMKTEEKTSTFYNDLLSVQSLAVLEVKVYLWYDENQLGARACWWGRLQGKNLTCVSSNS